MILRTICLLLLFFIFLAIGRKIVLLLSAVDNLPLIGSANTLLGGLMGVGWSVIILYCLSLILLFYFALSGGGNAFINEPALSQGYLFSFFYRLIA